MNLNLRCNIHLKSPLIMRTHNFLLLCLLMLLCACSKSIADDEFTTNLNKWNSKQMNNYDFTMGIDCYCPSERVGPHLVGVKNNVLTTINNLPYDEAKQGKIMTINELFEYIKTSDAKKPFKKEVLYDSTNGYPKYVYYDFVENISDEEVGYYIINLQKK